MSQLLNLWIHAARPKTLIVGMSPVLIGSAMAFEKGLFSTLIFLMTIIGVLCLQIGTNYANDYYDFMKGADTVERMGPKKVLQGSIISPLQMKQAFYICFALFAIIGLELMLMKGPFMVIITLVSIAFGVLYSAGPYSLARIGLADLVVLIFFGPVATIVTYMLHTSSWNLPIILASLPPGLMGIAILTVNNLRDEKEDRKAHKKTLVVRWGSFYGKVQYLMCFLLSAVIPIFLTFLSPKHFLCCMGTLAFLPAFPLLKVVFNYKNPKDLNLVLPKTGILLLLYTGCFCLGWIL